MTDTATDTTLARLAALEAMVAALAVQPLATVPPITIGELTNVPAPGSQLAAQWAQDVSSRVVQRFATTAALKAWAAPVGAFAVALDTGVMWRRDTGPIWTQHSPWTATQYGVAVGMKPGAGTYPLATINVPADPSANRVAYVTAVVRVYKFGPAAQTSIWVSVDGAVQLDYVFPTTVDLSQTAGDLLPMTASLSGRIALPAGKVVPIVANVNLPGSNGARVDAGGPYNRLDVLVVPRGY